MREMGQPYAIERGMPGVTSLTWFLIRDIHHHRTGFDCIVNVLCFWFGRQMVLHSLIIMHDVCCILILYAQTKLPIRILSYQK